MKKIIKTTNLNGWIWRKTQKWKKIIKLINLNGWIWPKNVSCCLTFSVMFKWCMFVGVIFSVMYKCFGHIHLVILNWSNDYSSIFFYFFLFYKKEIDGDFNAKMCRKWLYNTACMTLYWSRGCPSQKYLSNYSLPTYAFICRPTYERPWLMFEQFWLTFEQLWPKTRMALTEVWITNQLLTY